MSKSVNVDFVTRQIEVDTDGKEHFISAAMAAKDAEQSMLSAQNAANVSLAASKYIKGQGYTTPETFCEKDSDGNIIEPSSWNEHILSAIGTGLNVVLSPRTYNIDGDLIITLNNQWVKCLNGKATLFSLTGAKRDAGTNPAESKGCLVIKGQHFDLENIVVDGNTIWAERPIRYANMDTGFAAWESFRNLCVPVVKFIDATFFKCVGLEARYGECGFLISNSSNYVFENCISEYTYGDGFMNTYKSHHGIFSNCVANYAGDDSFTAFAAYISGEVDDLRPHNIELYNCKADSCAGAIVCFAGAYNCVARDCSAKNCRMNILRATSFSHSQAGANYDVAHDIIFDNIDIECVDNMIAPWDLEYNNIQVITVPLVGSYDDVSKERTYNITFNNINIYKQKTSYDIMAVIHHTQDGIFNNVKLNGMSLRATRNENISFYNLGYDGTDGLLLQNSNNVTINNSVVKNANNFKKPDTVENHDYCIGIDRTYNITLNNNYYSCDNATNPAHDIYVYTQQDELVDNKITIDTVNVYAQRNVPYHFNYNGVLKGDAQFNIWEDGQLYLDVNNKLAMLLNGKGSAISKRQTFTFSIPATTAEGKNTIQVDISSLGLTQNPIGLTVRVNSDNIIASVGRASTSNIYVNTLNTAATSNATTAYLDVIY